MFIIFIKEDVEELRYHRKVFLPAEIETKTAEISAHVGEIVNGQNVVNIVGGEGENQKGKI